MSCRHLGNAIICAPKPVKERIVYRICTSNRYKCAGRPKRRMEAKFYEWYGWTITCLTCDKDYFTDDYP